MPEPPTPARFAALSAAGAVVAALAAYVSLLAAPPVWAMFMGWAVHNSRGRSARDGALDLACFAVGLVIAMEAMVAAAALMPAAGPSSPARQTRSPNCHIVQLVVIVWHMLRKCGDYAGVRPALHAEKPRDLELRSGQPARRGAGSAGRGTSTSSPAPGRRRGGAPNRPRPPAAARRKA